MKNFLFPAFVLFLLTACSDTPTDRVKDSAAVDTTIVAYSSPIGGVYSFGIDPKTEPCGTVMIYPESDSTFLFWLDFTRGAPSYNMAQLAERGIIVGDTGIYYADYPDRDESCKIKFYFKKDFVQIENTERDCGFGANCMIDHVYERKSSTVPQFYIGPEGDTVYFSKLSKDL